MGRCKAEISAATQPETQGCHEVKQQKEPRLGGLTVVRPPVCSAEEALYFFMDHGFVVVDLGVDTVVFEGLVEQMKENAATFQDNQGAHVSTSTTTL